MLLVQHPQPGQGGQKHPGVELRRPLPEAVPVDDARAVTDVENMPRVESAMHQARGGVVPRLRAGQGLGQRPGCDTDREVCGPQRADPGTRLVHHARGAKR